MTCELGMAAHTYNLSTQRSKQENCHEFEVSLDYMLRPCFKKKSKQMNR